jgi:hypothetical protein
LFGEQSEEDTLEDTDCVAEEGFNGCNENPEIYVHVITGSLEL